MIIYTSSNNEYHLTEIQDLYKNHKLLIVINNNEDGTYNVDMLIKHKCLLKIIINTDKQYHILGISMLDTIDLHNHKLKEAEQLQYLQDLLKVPQETVDKELVVNNLNALFETHFRPPLNTIFKNAQNINYEEFVNIFNKYRYLSKMHKKNIYLMCEFLNKCLETKNPL